MKPWLRFVIFAAVLGASLAPVRAAERAITSVPATVQLSGLLSQSIPALPQTLVAIPPAFSSIAGTPEVSVVPAAFDVAKAQVLLTRTGDIALPNAAAQTAETKNPQEVIRAVNSVLKDFSTDDIAKLSDSDIHAVSGLIMDQLQGRSKHSSLDAVVVLARAKADKLIALRAQPVRETLLNPGHGDRHGDMITAKGVPPQARLLRPTEEAPRVTRLWQSEIRPIDKDTVFRHYTTAEGYKHIMETKTLWNGFVPYVELAPGTYKKTFVDVSGLFLTLPSVKGDRVGVPSREFTHYVDLVLPAKLPLMEIEAGAIYLVPLPGAARDWVLDYYLRWATGKEIASDYARMIGELDPEGGPGPKVQVPIKLVGHGKVR